MAAKPQAAWFCLMASLVMAAQHMSGEAPLHTAQGRNGDDLNALLASLWGTADDDDGVDPPDFARILADLETLAPDVLGRLSGLLIARHLNVTKRLYHGSVKALVARMDPDVASVWRPDEAFFKRLKAQDLTECLIEVNHGALPASLSARAKKAELVAKAVELAPAAGWLPKPLRTACYTGPGSDTFIPAAAAEGTGEGAAADAAAPDAASEDQEAA